MKLVLTKEFKESEFECRCGCGLGLEHMDKDIILRMMTARKTANVPFVIRSAIRCATHNKNSGGSDTSSHLKGNAIDIGYKGMADLMRIVEALIAAGIPRIGINKDLRFIHIDNDPLKPKGMFIY